MVVVGGDAAGMSAASQARRRRGADDLEIVAFERGGHTSYSACGLPYYAGDVVKDWRRLVSSRPVNYHLGTIANKQGRVCGINIGGGYATFPGVLGTAVSKICNVEVARTGLSEAELGRLGLGWESATVDSTTRAAYFPGAAPIRTKVLAERRSGRLLGAQIVGREGAAKRIDVFATAIWNGMAVDEMVNLDLSYAPPFSPVWDPVLIAVRKLSEQVERNLQDCL